MTKNIFIIGDLIIDHTVFVELSKGPHQHHRGEQVYYVMKRQNTAGGAASVARAATILNHGRTYLWGALGGSHWGSFRAILEGSQLLDASEATIELRGEADPTGAPMNTVTRLVSKDEGAWRILLRFDDANNVHVTEGQRQSVLYNLLHVHRNKHALDAIIIYDLDRKCLTRSTIKAIGDFAKQEGIPLFVDPKRDASKYVDINGTAILPNLSEWAHLVEDSARYEYWYQNLDKEHVLAEMAQRSFRHLGNFKYHLISCGAAGTVLIAPHPDKAHLYAVYRFPRYTQRYQLVSEPLGSGDVFTAISALMFDKSRDTTDNMLRAVHASSLVVACYREMPWQRMPSSSSVEERLAATQYSSVAPMAHPSKALLFLPKRFDVSLRRYETEIPGVFTCDPSYAQELRRLVADLKSQSDGSVRSIILGAPSGSGKSAVITGLVESLTRQGIKVELVSGTDLARQSNLAREEQPGVIEKLKNEGVRVVIVDEAYGKHFEEKGCQDWLQQAHSEGIRCVFVDSSFDKAREPAVPVRADIASRCLVVHLSGLFERPMDIPLVVFSYLLRLSGGTTIEVDGKLLLATTEQILEQRGNPRQALKALDPVYAAAVERKGKTVALLYSDLSDKEPPRYLHAVKDTYMVSS